VPLVNLPTHVSRNSIDKCLDHIWFSQLHTAETVVFKIDITDHLPIMTIISLKSSVNDRIYKKFRDHSSQSLLTLRNQMEIYVANFIIGYNDVNTTVNNFLDGLFDVYDRCCPLRTKYLTYSHVSKPWMNNDLMAKINRKHRLFRSYKRGEVDFDYYNRFKNQTTRAIRETKSRYIFTDKFYRCRGDVTSTWKSINSLTGRKKKKCDIREIEVDEQTISDPKIVANKFNTYFSSVASDLDSQIPASDMSPLNFLGDPNTNSMFASPSIAQEVITVICKLKNSSFNHKTIPTFIFKHCSDILGQPISDMFNLTLTVGIFPECLKLARVIPIFKSGNVKALINYRPISTLPVMSKIFEKLMFSRLNSFLKGHNILCNNQFGFRKNNCTSDAILEFVDHVITSLHNRKTLISVFLDFSKAFDTVDHKILMDKLNHLGIRGMIGRWFQSYLSNRSQYVLVDTSVSNVCLINRGVPQGSVLGPLLFLIYINDMSKSCDRLKLVHFADDTTAFAAHNDVVTLVEETNGQLNRVQEWLRANRLSLNIVKTSCMFITDRRALLENAPVIRIGNEVVKEVEHTKFLGVYLDNRLNFAIHTDALCKKLSRSIGVLNRLTDLAPPRVKLSIYNSLIFSHLIYGIVAWGGSSVSNVQRIDKLLKRAGKIVRFTGAGRPQFDVNLFTTRSAYEYFVSIKMFRVVRLGEHEHFLVLFNNLLPEHEHLTRFNSGLLYNTPQYCKSKCQKSFLFQSVDIWNRLPAEIKNCNTLNKFKFCLKNYLLNIT